MGASEASDNVLALRGKLVLEGLLKIRKKMVPRITH